MSKSTEIEYLSNNEDFNNEEIFTYIKKNKSVNESIFKNKIKISPEKQVKEKYIFLLNKIKKDQELIEELEEENNMLKSQIENLNRKVESLPDTKKRYEELTKNISKAHRSYLKTQNLED